MREESEFNEIEAETLLECLESEDIDLGTFVSEMKELGFSKASCKARLKKALLFDPEEWSLL